MLLTSDDLVNMKIAHSNNTRSSDTGTIRLEILEVVYIREKFPNINIQMNLVNKIALV